MKTRISLALAAIIACLPSYAAWTLDGPESMVSFVSVKAGDIAEVHWFTEVTGSITDEGSAQVVIQLASVDTMIPIRDERMREMLFNTDIFPVATLSATVDLEALKSIEVGRSHQNIADVTLDLNGQKVELKADVSVTNAGHSTFLVSSRKPLILNAASVDLVDGIEALREIAGLSTISNAVPVSFVLSFKPVHTQ